MLRQSSLPQETDTGQILELVRRTGSQEPSSSRNGGWVGCLPTSLEPRPASDTLKYPHSSSSGSVGKGLTREKYLRPEIKGARATARTWGLEHMKKPAATHQNRSACAADRRRKQPPQQGTLLQPGPNSIQQQQQAESHHVSLFLSSAEPASGGSSHPGTKITLAKTEDTDQFRLTCFLCRKVWGDNSLEH